jgi:predicted aspartyl protease
MLLPASTFTLLPVSHPQKLKRVVTATVINLADPKKRMRIQFRVDSGAVYSVVPKAYLRQLGIRPCGSKSFALADGTAITRKMGNALFSLEGTEGASPVIFGEKGDTPLLGMVSLEALGYILDPLPRELRPLPMVLG